MAEFAEKNKRGTDVTGLSLPLVSVIVINYNYSHFLRGAVESIFAQTYPNIECIIVDNSSTDDSSKVTAQLRQKYPTIKYLQREENGGQSIAAKDGFDASQGEYIVLLDSDDLLFPTFVATHIFVHLSLRVPVGLTTADMVQTTGSNVVIGTCACVSDYVMSGKGERPRLIRRVDQQAHELWRIPAPGADFESRLHFVPPFQASSWFWSPTSGNCFRRDAIQLFLNTESLAELRACTDAYLLRGVGLMTGSVLIDEPLAAYRLHNNNQFSKHPDLYCLIAFQRNSPTDFNALAKKMLINHLVTNTTLFVAKLQTPQYFIDALTALNEAWPNLPGSYLRDQLIAERKQIIQQIGRAKYSSWLKRLRAPPS